MSPRRVELTPGTCDVGDCSNIGDWFPTVLVYPLGVPKHKVAPFQMEFGLIVCDHHRILLEPSDLITDESWKMITEMLVKQKGLKPDRGATELRFNRIPDPFIAAKDRH
jgi:hypothetical protein